MRFCASFSGDDLEAQFAALSLGKEKSKDGKNTKELTGPTLKEPTSEQRPQTAPEPSRIGLGSSKFATLAPASMLPPPRSSSKTAAGPLIEPPRELVLLLSAMRKLRESIVATHRTDNFAQRAYIFVIRAAILCRNWESYAPALLYLLSAIHPATALSPTELHEFVGYRVLDAACRLGDIGLAHQIKVQYGYQDRRVGLVLRALVMDDWVVFWRVRRAVDGYQRRLMEASESDLRLHVLKCLGKTYFAAERSYVEKCAGMEWDGLVKEYKVGWELAEGGDRVVIRRMKPKPIGGDVK